MTDDATASDPYTGNIWLPWRLKSQATRTFFQHFVPDNTKKRQIYAMLALYDMGKLSVTSDVSISWRHYFSAVYRFLQFLRKGER